MAAVRLDEERDNIESTLSSALIESGSSAAAKRSITMGDPLASSSWEEVTNCKYLIENHERLYIFYVFVLICKILYFTMGST